MHTNRTIGVLALVGFLAVAGCQSPQQKLAEEGFKPASPQEIESMLAGKTVKSSGGKDYYAADGSYVSLWKGQIYEGTWRAEEPNKLCWDVENWGCSEVYTSGDSIKSIYNGKIFEKTASDFEEGNTIQ